MALNIKDPETDRLARELAARTGTSITEAVKIALQDSLKRHPARTSVRLSDEILEISRRAAKLPHRTDQTPEEIIGYDETGKPK